MGHMVQCILDPQGQPQPCAYCGTKTPNLCTSHSLYVCPDCTDLHLKVGPSGPRPTGRCERDEGTYLRVVVADHSAVLFRSDPNKPFEYLRGERLTDALETLPWVAVGPQDPSS